jgi:hypothetical protein
MSSGHPRIIREKKTIKTMIRLYCKNNHTNEDKLCLECQELFDYALQRLEKCPFQEKKPTCTKCVIHCYKPSMRKKIRAIMRYSGPHMLLKQPILTLQHIIDGFKKPR